LASHSFIFQHGDFEVMVARIRADASTRREKAAGGNYFANPKTDLKFIPSGCKPLDLALGGGWVRGRVANIVGDKSTGKTLLCIEACANFLRIVPKGKIRYREAEAAFDRSYARALGMPVDRIDFGSADKAFETVEDMFEDLEHIVANAKGPELVIVDSLDALSDRSEIDRAMDQGTYGAQKAKLLSQLFRRLIRKMEHKDVTLIIVSQVRDKIGVSFGRTTTRSGGKALDFYASQVVYLAHVGRIVKTVSGLKRPTGVKVLAKLDKNKVALPFREAAFSIRFGYGIDDAQACVDWLNETNSLKLAGLKKEDVPNYLNYVLEMSIEDGNAEIDRLREIVEQKWYEIEGKMLTPRSKYA
jgi:recombination protein RecA